MGSADTAPRGENDVTPDKFHSQNDHERRVAMERDRLFERANRSVLEATSLPRMDQKDANNARSVIIEGGETCFREATPPTQNAEKATECRTYADSSKNPQEMMYNDPTERSQLLYHPRDHHALSELKCFIRSQVEVFVTTAADISVGTKLFGHSSRGYLGRVGIRCAHCVHSNSRATSAVLFPTCIRLMAQATQKWQHLHFGVCEKIPDEVKSRYERIKNFGKRKRGKGNESERYWEEECYRMGLVDTGNGIQLRYGVFLNRNSEVAAGESTKQEFVVKAADGEKGKTNYWFEAEKQQAGLSVREAQDIPLLGVEKGEGQQEDKETIGRSISRPGGSTFVAKDAAETEARKTVKEDIQYKIFDQTWQGAAQLGDEKVAAEEVAAGTAQEGNKVCTQKCLTNSSIEREEATTARDTKTIKRRIVVESSKVHDEAFSNDSKAQSQLLYHPRDHQTLSEIKCLIRSQVEVFTTTADDLNGATKLFGHSKKKFVGRVGIRCTHCAHSKKRATSAAVYPMCIRLIPQATQKWQHRHFGICKEIPDEVKLKYERLKSFGKGKKTKGGEMTKYWEEDCRRMGLVDTDNGIRLRDGVFASRDEDDYVLEQAYNRKRGGSTKENEGKLEGERKKRKRLPQEMVAETANHHHYHVLQPFAPSAGAARAHTPCNISKRIDSKLAHPQLPFLSEIHDPVPSSGLMCLAEVAGSEAAWRDGLDALHGPCFPPHCLSSRTQSPSLRHGLTPLQAEIMMEGLL